MAQTDASVEDTLVMDADSDSEPSDAEGSGLGVLDQATNAPAENHESSLSSGKHDVGHGDGTGHGEHAGINIKFLLLQILNFSVFLFILIKFGGSAMRKFLRGRHELIKKDVHDASELLKQAKQKAEEQERRLASLEKEIANLRDSIQKDAEREQARLIASAQEKAKRIQEETRVQLDQQVRSAEARLRAEVATASIKLAEELLKRTVSPEDDRRLAREFVTSFESSPMPGRRVP